VFIVFVTSRFCHTHRWTVLICIDRITRTCSSFIILSLRAKQFRCFRRWNQFNEFSTIVLIEILSDESRTSLFNATWCYPSILPRWFEIKIEHERTLIVDFNLAITVFRMPNTISTSVCSLVQIGIDRKKKAFLMIMYALFSGRTDQQLLIEMHN
jgi:hypothetical protein